MYWGTLEESFTCSDTIFVKYFLENSVYDSLHSVIQGECQCERCWNRSQHKALTFTITKTLKFGSLLTSVKIHCF